MYRNFCNLQIVFHTLKILPIGLNLSTTFASNMLSAVLNRLFEVTRVICSLCNVLSLLLCPTC